MDDRRPPTGRALPVGAATGEPVLGGLAQVALLALVDEVEVGLRNRHADTVATN